MNARKTFIAILILPLLIMVGMCGTLIPPEETEHQNEASAILAGSIHLYKPDNLYTIKIEMNKPEQTQANKNKNTPVQEATAKQQQEDAEPDIPPSAHSLIADVLELYMKEHHEEGVSREQLLQYIGWADSMPVDIEIDPLWIIAMMWQESRFKNAIESSSGAIGLLQILPSTAKVFGVSKKQLSDPKINIETSIAYLSYLLNKYDGSLRTATIAYNQGEGNVDRGKARSWYYTSVKRHYDKLTLMLKEVSKDR